MTAETNIPINIYCDESRHTSDPSDTYMVIGGIACPREEKREIVHQIHLLKKRYNTQGEFGWKRLSPNRRDFYGEVLDLFARESRLSFRCLVVDRTNLDHEMYNQGDQELGFYKLYYQMLIHWLKPRHEYHIYLDWQQNKTQHRFSTLRDILRRKLSGRAKIACLEPVGSKNTPLIEMTDLLIGAVGYEWNGRNASKTKLAFCQKLAASMNMKNLSVSTFAIKDKFDIFHFSGR
jgi:hypothetical protein